MAMNTQRHIGWDITYMKFEIIIYTVLYLYYDVTSLCSNEYNKKHKYTSIG